MSSNIQLVDPFNRVIDSLRILVTSRCNYKCIFCHREGLFSKTDENLTPEDYGFIAKTARELGIIYYKLTGGEPLVRTDIAQIVEAIKPYSREISLVTNGYFLADRIKDLADAGLDRANVSLHSVTPSIYEYITGGIKGLERVLNGIKKAIEYGVRVKLNYLLMRSNMPDFEKIIKIAENLHMDVNVIELIPLGVPREVYSREHVSVKPIIDYLERRHVKKYYRELHNRPVYLLESGIKVEVVIGYGNALFCTRCSRLRLTPDGYLKPCLYVDDPKINITKAVKERDKDGVVKAFKDITLLRKPYFNSSEWDYARSNGRHF